MNRKITAVILAALTAFAAGCGSTPQNAAADTSAVQTDETTAETTNPEDTSGDTLSSENGSPETDTDTGEKKYFSPEELTDLNHRFFTANQIDGILSKHTSAEYVFNNGYPNSKDKADHFYLTQYGMYAEGSSSAQYCFDRTVLMLSTIRTNDNEYYDMQYIMDFSKNYTSHPNCYVPDLESEWFDPEHEVITEGYEQDGKIYLFIECDEESSRFYIENTVGKLYTGQTIKTELVADAQTLEMTSHHTVSVIDGEPEEIQTITAEYDTPEPSASRVLKMAFSRAAYRFMNVSYIYEPDTPGEMRLSLDVPQNVSVGFIADNRSDFTVYTDRECTQPLTEWDGMSDITAYIRANGTEAGTETENDTGTGNTAEE